MKKIISILILACILAGCRKEAVQTGQTENNQQTPPVETAFKSEKMSSGMIKGQKSFFGTFDTVIDIMAYTEDEDQFISYFKYAQGEFQRLHKLYDNYNSYEGLNNIHTVNEKAGIEPVVVDKDLLDLIAFSIDAYHLTQGKVNIAMGPVLAVWHDYREAGIADPQKAQLPPMEKLEEANKLTDINKVIVDPEASTVFLEEKGMSLDLGAVAKGYATELVAKGLEAQGLKSAIISAGGNVRTIGTPQDGSRKRWGIGIQNPDLTAEENVVAVLYPKEASIVTSGDYQRFYKVDGKIYHHLIDPETLMPSTYFRSVSIMTPDSGLADLWSTALFLSDLEEGQKMAQAHKIDVLWYDMDMKESYTQGIGHILKTNGATSTME